MKEVKLRLVLQRYNKVRGVWLESYVPHCQCADELHKLVRAMNAMGEHGAIEYFINEEEVPCANNT